MWEKKKKIFLILFLLAIIPGIIFFFLIEKANLLFFGKGYESFYGYSKIFAIFIVLALPIYLADTYIITKKMTSALLYGRPLYFIIKIILSVIFIRWWDLLGAVWAYNASILLLFVLYLFLIKMHKQAPERQLD
jgi:O-antigen/teichoic acid export membrane protein